jgi:hypothetical protein
MRQPSVLRSHLCTAMCCAAAIIRRRSALCPAVSATQPVDDSGRKE